MQDQIMSRLEDYLSGRLPAGADAGFEAALSVDGSARADVLAMAEQAGWIREALRVEGDVAPAPGFYARVMNRIEAEPQPGLLSIFLEPFGRRLVYAAGALMVVLAVAMYSSESAAGPELAGNPSSAGILVDAEPGVHLVGETNEDRGRVLVTLTAFEQ
jgi:anti-sigma factor RsiW